MKNYLLAILVLLSSLLWVSTSFAIAKQPVAKGEEKQVPAPSHPAQNLKGEILVYEQPDEHSKIVAKLMPNVSIIPFYRKSEWVKIGSSVDGSVGWINIPQYFKARENFYQQNVQTVFMQVQQNGNSPATHIIVYKNGEKLNDKQAAELYKKFQNENEQRIRNVWMNDSIFFDEMQRNLTEMQRFNNEWFSPPIIIVPDASALGKDNNKQNKQK